MRHQNRKKILGRVSSQRQALLRNLAESLVLHGSIQTTKAKAAAIRPLVETLVTKAKQGNLAQARRIRQILYTDEAIKKILTEIAPRYQNRPGGYLRVIRLAPRANDQAAMVQIEFV